MPLIEDAPLIMSLIKDTSLLIEDAPPIMSLIKDTSLLIEDAPLITLLIVEDIPLNPSVIKPATCYGFMKCMKNIPFAC